MRPRPRSAFGSPRRNYKASRTPAAVDAPRSYKVIDTSVGSPGGRYMSKSGPQAAAKKAASIRFREAPASVQKIRLTVQETTRGSAKQEFSYEAQRIKLDEPFVQVINGEEITHEYEVHIRSV